MHTYALRVFPHTQAVSVLRFENADGRRIDERTLERHAIEQFATQVEDAYHKIAPSLTRLGQELYAWADGPSQRWLQRIQQTPPGLALHIDVEERLRHLPWELLHAGQLYLCADALQPFTPVRRVTDHSAPLPLANRPLRVLFMATSPEDVRPVLNFEDEERRILDATRAARLELIVEESGSLHGLHELLQAFGPGYFDVLHLSGHADVTNGVPHFIMEDEIGLRQDATAEDIAQTFAGLWPRLVFLSGCKTGQAPDQGGLPSMSEALVQAGAPAVLGWALPVGDAAASMLAAPLYAHLATGMRLDEAVARARQKLLEQNNPNWHLLRLYANATPLTEVVTRPRTPGRQPLPHREASQDFLDASLGRVAVASRESFVGRRRPMQRCLKALSGAHGETYEGLLLHGMGGLGKSTLATRLCERMSPTHQRAVWHGKIDDTEFLKLPSKVQFPEISMVTQANDILNTPGLDLHTRVQYFLAGPLASTPCLFVFDNFEDGNLELTASGSYVATPAALDILTALLGAIRATDSSSRVIITSRYQFPLPAAGTVYQEGLESMRGPELEKKLQLLPALRHDATTDPALKQRAITTSAGNPRLLEWLDRVLADRQTDTDVILSAMEQKEAEFREQVLAETLLSGQKRDLRQMLALTQIFDIPVPLAAVQAVAGAERVAAHLDRAVALGLMEQGVDPTTRQPRYLVSKILLPLLEITDAERQEACRQGAQALYRLWVLEEQHAH